MRPLVAALVLLALPAFAETYKVDVKASELVVKTWKDGVAAAFAHNHVIQATDFSGELSYDAEKPDATKVQVTVQVASLTPDDSALRKKFGETAEVGEGDRKKVAANMLSPDQLDGAKFPTITFASTSVGKDKKGGMLLLGQLTLHGVTKPVEVPVTIAVKDGQAIGDGKLRFKTSDFGVKPYSTGLGSIKNRDEVELALHLVGATSSRP
jgi:polyisoprenoid-binding protein YceI